MTASYLLTSLQSSSADINTLSIKDNEDIDFITQLPSHIKNKVFEVFL